MAGTKKAPTWGEGAAPLAAPIKTKETTERIVVAGDLHYPFEDDAAVKATLALIRDIAPHRILLNGDILDFPAISRWNQGLERLDDLQAEIDESNGFRRAVREAAPRAWIGETLGNHSRRAVTYVQTHARALTSLRMLKPAELFEHRPLRIDLYPEAGLRVRPELLIRHGDTVRKGSGSTAKAEMVKAGISVVHGHTHRLAVVRVNGYAPRVGVEGGCLCRTDPSYIDGVPDWQPGLIVIEASRKTAAFNVIEVPFIEGSLRLGLSRYSGT